MNKEELIRDIERMLQDNVNNIDSCKGTEKEIYSWIYAREDLQNVLKIIKYYTDKDEIFRIIEDMYYDKNYYINSGKGHVKQKYAWENARVYLQKILEMIKNLD